MPGGGHSSRWCKYSIEFTQPNGKVWQKTYARSVKTDPDIDQFKRDCQNDFLQANPGANLTRARTHFEDGFQNQPPNTKLI